MEPEITLTLTGDCEAIAVFEESGPEPGLVCINEINYNSSDNFNPEDWVELFNAGQTAIDISSWQFKDEEDDHVFVIDDDTILGAGEYLVICNDSDQFEECFSEVTNYVGDMDFGLSGSGELIRLFDADGNLIDSVEYDDGGDWPSEPDGGGPTLELIEATYDNSLPSSWRLLPVTARPVNKTAPAAMNRAMRLRSNSRSATTRIPSIHRPRSPFRFPFRAMWRSRSIIPRGKKS